MAVQGRNGLTEEDGGGSGKTGEGVWKIGIEVLLHFYFEQCWVILLVVNKKGILPQVVI